MERLQNKGEKLTYQKQDDKNVKIDEEQDAEFLDVTPPDYMEEGISDEKYDKNERIDEEK